MVYTLTSIPEAVLQYADLEFFTFKVQSGGKGEVTCFYLIAPGEDSKECPEEYMWARKKVRNVHGMI